MEAAEVHDRVVPLVAGPPQIPEAGLGRALETREVAAVPLVPTQLAMPLPQLAAPAVASLAGRVRSTGVPVPDDASVEQAAVEQAAVAGLCPRSAACPNLDSHRMADPDHILRHRRHKPAQPRTLQVLHTVVLDRTLQHLRPRVALGRTQQQLRQMRVMLRR